MNKPYFCRNFFLIDWRHRPLKNTIYLLLFYGEHFHGFSESDLCVLFPTCLGIRLLQMFLKIDLLKNFAIFSEKYLWLRPAALIKKRLWHRCFPVNIAKLLKTPFFIKHLRWLLLLLFRFSFNNRNHAVQPQCVESWYCENAVRQRI